MDTHVCTELRRNRGGRVGATESGDLPTQVFWTPLVGSPLEGTMKVEEETVGEEKEQLSSQTTRRCLGFSSVGSFFFCRELVPMVWVRGGLPSTNSLHLPLIVSSLISTTALLSRGPDRSYRRWWAKPIVSSLILLPGHNSVEDSKGPLFPLKLKIHFRGLKIYNRRLIFTKIYKTDGLSCLKVWYGTNVRPNLFIPKESNDARSLEVSNTSRP